MSSKLKIIIVTVFAFFIGYNFWKAWNPEEHVQGPTPVVTADFLIKENKVSKKLIEEPFETSKVFKKNNAYKKYLKELLPAAQKRDIKCGQVADGLFEDPSFIDVEDPFYKDPLRIIKKLHNVYVNTLVRVEVVDAYKALSLILESSDSERGKLTPSIYRNQIGLLEYYCRPEMSLRFIETVMEVNKRYKFSPQMRKDIFEMSLGMLDSVISDMFTTNNLIYGLGFLKLMIENSILSNDTSEEITPLFDKILEHHKAFTDAWQREKESRDSKTLWPLLKEDYIRRTELGIEFRELLQRLRTRYQSN